MSIYKSRHDGKEYYNHQIGSARDKAMDSEKGGGVSKAKPKSMDKSGKAKAESEHSSIEGEQENGKGEDIHSVVAEHGPAHKMEMEKHPEGGFSVKTTHGEHVHEHRAEQFHEASAHAASAFGEENPDEFKQEENAGAHHGKGSDIGGLGNLGSVVTGIVS